MSRRRRTLATAFGVVLLFLLPLLPELLGTRILVFRDPHLTHWPWRRTAMTALDSGRVPFINQNASGGQPLLANPNAVLLYPTVLLERLVKPVSAFNVHYLLSTVWAFLGACVLARRVGISAGGSLFAGVTYAFSGMAISYGSAFLNSGAAASWLPWCGAAAIGLLEADTLREKLRAAAATGVAFGLQLLAGEPAITLLTGLFVTFLCLAALASKPAPSRPRGLVVLAAGGAVTVVIALAFASPLLLPLRAVFPLTYRGQHAYSMRAFGAAPFTWSRMIEWLFPRFSGDPSLPGSGASWMRARDGDLVYIWCVTLGVVAAVVVLLGACRRDFWNRRSIPLAAMALAAWLFSFGFQLPFYRLLFAVDALRRLRYPIKLYLLTTICVALLAGMAADALERRRAGRREMVLLGVLLVVFVGGFAISGSPEALRGLVASPQAGNGVADPVALSAFANAVRSDAVVGAAAVVLLASMLRFQRPKRPGNVLALASVVLSLPWVLPLFVSASARDMQRPPALAAHLRGPGRLFYSPAVPTPDFAALQAGRPGPPRFDKIARGLTEELTPSTGQAFGIAYTLDHDPDGSYGWYNRLASDVLGASTPAERSRLVRAYGARWILSGEGESFPGFEPVVGMLVAGRRLVLSETPSPLAEVRWSAREFRRASLTSAVQLIRSEAFDPQTDVVLPGRSDRDPAASASGRSLPDGRIDVASLTPEGVSGSVAAPAPGFLVFARTYFGAWKASVDGRSVPALVANARDVAIAVPEGSHAFSIEWDRGPFHRGVAAQGVALAVALAVGIATTMTSRRTVMAAGALPPANGPDGKSSAP